MRCSGPRARRRRRLAHDHGDARRFDGDRAWAQAYVDAMDRNRGSRRGGSWTQQLAEPPGQAGGHDGRSHRRPEAVRRGAPPLLGPGRGQHRRVPARSSTSPSATRCITSSTTSSPCCRRPWRPAPAARTGGAPASPAVPRSRRRSAGSSLTPRARRPTRSSPAPRSPSMRSARATARRASAAPGIQVRPRGSTGWRPSSIRPTAPWPRS